MALQLHRAEGADRFPKDSDGEDCIYLNRYRCDDCAEEWEDQWSCGCNDECPTCGHEIEPYESLDLRTE